MAKVDFLEYFLVKEQLVDLNYREIYAEAQKGDEAIRLISDMNLARKYIYQGCKTAKTTEDLRAILISLSEDVPEFGMVFNQTEFEKAWQMTIKEILSNFVNQE